MNSRIEPFHAIAISQLAHKLRLEGRPVIHMEFGQPSTGAPAGAIATAQQILAHDPMGYWESVPLKQRISQYYRERYGVAVAPGRILLTCGASPALVLALSTAFVPGDRVALARPGYVAYRNCLRALHMDEIELECSAPERFQISAAAIAAIDPPPRGVIIASPANPTGTIIAPQELAAIAELCRDRGIRIVSDEIYHGLSYGAPAQSMLQHSADAIIINSFSKYFSMAGWRLGWMVVPDDLVDEARKRMGNMFLTPPSLSQHAALAAFECGDELDGHVETYRRNRALLLEALPALGLGEIAPPDGAFYIYASVAHLTDDSLGFCKKMLMETGVATAPGLDFDPVRGNKFIRFSFAVSTELVEEAIERLRAWLPQQALAA
ncbi:aminotransferase class I/II-fold pyridoxal phosphate-dependent enzyme [Sphingomonas sp. RT2P30]|uniref:aminotransferase class I/II-fold pyridoxal phosphate-dependent enzyme n=1 Tax=Parasphingomonas halimpatiens TaxID=3096162 RepID=UPI002FCC6702